jgi:hypothetical protein
MTTKHTPGPWTIVETGIDGLGTVICEVSQGANIEPDTGAESLYQIGIMSDFGDTTTEEARANAALIAAAPEMYEALRELEEAIRTEDKLNPGRIVTAEKLARAALAKAEGKAS